MKHRILIYSHDTFGLGHFRRSLTIASYLSRHIDGLSILMLTGLDSPAAFEAPPGVDFVKLPSIWKAGQNEYRSRHLKVSFSRVLRIRENMIRTITRAYDPSLFIVDNVPRGVDGEILSTLRHLRKHRPETRIALTLRDVLDAPEEIIAHWRELGVYRVMARFYDEIWVAGCKEIFNPIALYGLPAETAAKVRFCGYVVRSAPPGAPAELRRELGIGEAPLVVVSCGGGGDGYRLIDAYAGAVPALVERGIYSAVFLGPDMPAAQRRELKQRLLPYSQRVFTYDFRPDLVAFLQAASLSFSMGGYNTVSELLQAGGAAVVVPRTEPRLEQLIRAEAFARRKLLRVLPLEQLAPETVRRTVEEVLAAPRDIPTAPIDLAGARRITRRVRHLLRINGSSRGEAA